MKRRSLLLLKTILLIATIMMTAACGKDKPAKGSECTNCSSNSDCNAGLTCKCTNLGCRCMSGTSCKVKFPKLH